MLDSAIHEIVVFDLLDLIPMLIYGLIIVVLSIACILLKFFKISTVLLPMLFGVFILVYAVVYIAIFNYDIKNENFDVYYGEFEYTRYYMGHELDSIEFPDGVDLRVKSVADLGIIDGTHTGYLLYCKNSRWVLAYSKTPFEWLAPDTP